MMKTINCFRLESKGEISNSLAARFSTVEEAEKAIPAAGGYGGIVRPETITIYDTAIEWNARLDQEAQDSGLRKLTERERKALGL